jgi:hypothetical protein
MQIENSGAGQAAALGLTATGRPLTTAGLAAAQAAARWAVEAIERQVREVRKPGCRWRSARPLGRGAVRDAQSALMARLDAGTKKCLFA